MHLHARQATKTGCSAAGFGMHMAVDLALVVDVLPDQAAKDLGGAGGARTPATQGL